MPEFDTLLTGEQVARNLKVSKDCFWDHSSRMLNCQKEQHNFLQTLFCDNGSELTSLL
jgi:hypothetical protein